MCVYVRSEQGIACVRMREQEVGRGLTMGIVNRLQIHYTYMETGVEAEERLGGVVDCVQGRGDTSREQTFGIQCMHTLKTHEKLMQIIGELGPKPLESRGVTSDARSLRIRRTDGWGGKLFGITPNSSTFRARGVDFWLV